MNDLNSIKELLISDYYNSNYKKDNWSPYKTFVHCAQTIKYSMEGYPKTKPLIIQLTLGKIVFKSYLKQGYMKHNLSAPVPGSPFIEDSNDINRGIDILIDAIDLFQKFEGEFKRHLIFGGMTKEEYGTYFSMHIMDHLSEFHRD